MILDELTLHNFGVYQGEHKVVLSPTPGRPVVLIGGLNGGGKTTFLDALQIALYGRHARCVGRSKLGYAEYLKRAINRAVSTNLGAGVELVFRYRIDGRDEQFRVLRTWREGGSGVKDTVEVFRGKELDSAATERWHEFAEQFIPNQISDLFFFDGERIESLADPERSAELVRVGVHALLGLDLVDDLSRSLLQVERRRKADLATAADTDELAPVEQALETMANRRGELTAQMAALQIQLDRIANRRGDVERRFKTEGGTLFERREEIRHALAHHRGRLASAEERLRDLCGGLTPLVLVKELLTEARSIAGREDEVRRQMEFAEALVERDEITLRRLTEEGIGDDWLRVIAGTLRADRELRRQQSGSNLFLDIAPGRLDTVSPEALSQAVEQLRAAIEAQAEENDRVARLERGEGAIPDDARVEAILAELKTLHAEETTARLKLDLLGSEREQVEKERLAQERRRDELLEDISRRHASDQITRRVITHAARCRTTLQSFRKAMRERHVARLERLVTESFQKLIRKKTLVHHVSIDPESFLLHVHGENNAILPADRLSAGERQLLAVSVLWGLAKASGRELPAVIDTPLGRLDSEHRTYLVTHYFPAASHQVILLSTDEEIEGPYYADLKHSIAREYLIRYDERTHSSTIKPGYFERTRIAA